MSEASAGSPGPKPWERSELLRGEFPLSTRTKNPHADLDTRLSFGSGKHVGILTLLPMFPNFPDVHRFRIISEVLA